MVVQLNRRVLALFDAPSRPILTAARARPRASSLQRLLRGLGAFRVARQRGSHPEPPSNQSLNLMYEICFLGFQVPKHDKDRGSHEITEVFYFSDGDKLQYALLLHPTN